MPLSISWYDGWITRTSALERVPAYTAASTASNNNDSAAACHSRSIRGLADSGSETAFIDRHLVPSRVLQRAHSLPSEMEWVARCFVPCPTTPCRRPGPHAPVG